MSILFFGTLKPATLCAADLTQAERRILCATLLREAAEKKVLAVDRYRWAQYKPSPLLWMSTALTYSRIHNDEPRKLFPSRSVMHVFGITELYKILGMIQLDPFQLSGNTIFIRTEFEGETIEQELAPMNEAGRTLFNASDMEDAPHEVLRIELDDTRYGRAFEIQRSHPSLLIVVQPRGTLMVQTFVPFLSIEELKIAKQKSIEYPEIPVRVSAIDAKGIEYSVQFKNGKFFKSSD